MAEEKAPLLGINMKAVVIIAIILIAIILYYLFRIYSYADNYERCVEILGFKETKYEKIDGKDSCCWNEKRKLRCETWERLLEQKEFQLNSAIREIDTFS